MVPTELFLLSLREERPARVRGTAVFMTSNPGGIPNSLVHYFKHAKTLHEQVILLTVQVQHSPEVAEGERLAELIHLGEGFVSIRAHYGFMEEPDIPALMAHLTNSGVELNVSDVSFFLGRESLVFTGTSGMSLARKFFFKFLSQNAVAASSFFRLPPGRVVELGAQIEI